MVAKTLWCNLILLTVGLSACQTMRPELNDVHSAAHHDPDIIDQTPIVQNTYDAKQVVKQLQSQALALQSEGRWTEAELLLERALRIDAQQIDLYQQLATVRMGQQRFAQAEQIALKGLSIAAITAEQKAQLWQVIAQCRSAQSNIEGARAAREESKKWQP